MSERPALSDHFSKWMTYADDLAAQLARCRETLVDARHYLLEARVAQLREAAQGVIAANSDREENPSFKKLIAALAESDIPKETNGPK